MIGDYEQGAKTLQKTFPELSTEVLVGIQHYLGLSNATKYLLAYKSIWSSTGNEDKAHEAGELALKEAIEGALNKNNKGKWKTAPPNTKVKKYLIDYLQHI